MALSETSDTAVEICKRTPVGIAEGRKKPRSYKMDRRGLTHQPSHRKCFAVDLGNPLEHLNLGGMFNDVHND